MTPRAIPFRQALLLAYTVLTGTGFQYNQSAHAFCSDPTTTLTPRSSSPQHLLPSRPVFNSPAPPQVAVLRAQASSDDEDRSRPNIVVIKTHEDYVNFLEEDDRLCIVKFYASWCKSCARFGQRYRHFAFEEGDHINIENSIVHTGKVRFAEVEYSASAKLCKSLKVRKLPTTHMYRKGKGKVADMVCKPSQFQDVVDKVHDLLDGGDGDAAAALLGGESFEQPAILELEAETKTLIHAAEVTASKSNVNVTNTSFESLGDEIMTSLKQEEGMVNKIREGEKEVEKEKSWFPFSF